MGLENPDATMTLKSQLIEHHYCPVCGFFPFPLIDSPKETLTPVLHLFRKYFHFSILTKCFVFLFYQKNCGKLGTLLIKAKTSQILMFQWIEANFHCPFIMNALPVFSQDFTMLITCWAPIANDRTR